MWIWVCFVQFVPPLPKNTPPPFRLVTPRMIFCWILLDQLNDWMSFARVTATQMVWLDTYLKMKMKTNVVLLGEIGITIPPFCSKSVKSKFSSIPSSRLSSLNKLQIQCCMSKSWWTYWFLALPQFSSDSVVRRLLCWAWCQLTWGHNVPCVTFRGTEAAEGKNT